MERDNICKAYWSVLLTAVTLGPWGVRDQYLHTCNFPRCKVHWLGSFAFKVFITLEKSR